jgi:hypothetical protein
VRADATASQHFGELVWGNSQLWALVAPPSPLPMPSNMLSTEPFYELAPQIPSAGLPTSPQSFACEHLGIIPGTNSVPCAHDHVIPAPPGNAGAFNANWHVFLVLCSPTGVSSGACTPEVVSGTLFTGQQVSLPLAQSVTLPGTSTPTPLTSVPLIQSALSSGAVIKVDTGVVFICTIAPVVS